MTLMAACPSVCSESTVSEVEPAINADRPQLEVAQGRTGTTTLTMIRVGGFTGAISLRAVTVPAGVTVTFDPAVVPAGSTTTTVRVSVAQSVAPTPASGDIDLGLEATGEGVKALPFTIRLRVASSAAPDFTLQASPQTLQPRVDETATSVVSATLLGGLTGPVTFTHDNAFDTSEEVAVNIQPGATPNTANVRITPLTTPSDGRVYSVRLRATAPGVTFNASRHTISIAVSVSQPPRIVVERFDQFRPDPLVITTGERDTVSLRIRRFGNFSGSVSLSLADVPAELTASLDPTTTTGNVTLLTVATNPNIAQTLDRTLKVVPRATTTTGVIGDTLYVRVRIRPRPAVGTYSLSAPNVTVAQGTTATSVLTISRSADFNGEIILGVGPLTPNSGLLGVQVTSPIVAGNGLITVSTPLNPQPGVYRYEVVGTAAGQNPVRTEFTVTVTQARTPTSIFIRKLVGGVPQATGGETIAVSGTVSLVAEIRDQTGTLLTAEPTTWTSSNTAVATVDANGVVRGLTAGTANIVVRPTNNPNNIQATLPITVAAPVPTTIAILRSVNGTLQPSTSATLAAGNSLGLQTEVRDQNNAVLQNVPVTWASSNTSVATVTASGVVEAKAAGTAIISASPTSNPSVRSELTLTVTAAPASRVARIELEPKNAEITAPATQQYRVLFFDATGARTTVETGGSLQFTTSNSNVADVNAATGLANGKTAGTTTITARYLLNGQLVTQDATPLTVYAAGSANHQGSAVISTPNIGTGSNTRDVRRGEPITFQVLVYSTSNAPVTSGLNPAPTVTPSNPLVTATPVADPVSRGLPQGYYFDLTVPASVPVGATFTLRYDVTGAGGEITMRVLQ